jgi:hypothetical protein
MKLSGEDSCVFREQAFHFATLAVGYELKACGHFLNIIFVMLTHSDIIQI